MNARRGEKDPRAGAGLPHPGDGVFAAANVFEIHGDFCDTASQGRVELLHRAAQDA
ncbi:MAG: hypothetical protein WDN28_31250 [Chthoniobacter sp.]